MPDLGALRSDLTNVESEVLGVLIDADSAREGAEALLRSLAPVIDDACGALENHAAALAVRDRDGLAVHVLAEQGAPRSWPATLDPRFSVGAQAGIDPVTGVLVAPLRAKGRVVGFLLLESSGPANALLKDAAFVALLETAAAVLDALVTRTDAAVSRQAIALRSVQSVIDSMAHQMANPLTGASAIAQLLEDDLQDAGQRAAVRQLRLELGRGFAVLQDMLEFQRDTRAHAGVLDLNGFAEGATRFRGYAIREQGIALHLETSSGTMPVRADAKSLEHALLIVLRFAELQSRGSVNRAIDIRVVQRDASDLAIEITDSGPGGIPELTPSYFDIRFREDGSVRPAASETPDLGLADSIVRAAGGRLEARGSKSNGTTLSLVLPRAAASTHAQGRT
jgi:signal transduction histidine kinase